MGSLEWWQWAAQLGIGFVFAMVMVVLYYKSNSNMESRYRQHCEDTQDGMKQLLDTAIRNIGENTKVTSEMVTMLRVINGRLTNKGSDTGH